MGFFTTRFNRLAVFIVLSSLLLAGCGGGAGSSVPEMSVRESAIAAKTIDYDSQQNKMSLAYPESWSLQDSGNTITIESPTKNSSLLIADISYEMSLFLAGHADPADAARAVMSKYADSLAAGAAVTQNSLSASAGNDGTLTGRAAFAFPLGGGAQALTVINLTQVGSRVILDIVLTTAEEADDITDAYHAIRESIKLRGTEGTLQPADLSAEMGLPTPPAGYLSYYNPVTGQFFIYPDDWTIASSTTDTYAFLVNDQDAIMMMVNWSDKFYARYNSNGKDLDDCFDGFLEDCVLELEQDFGDVRFTSYEPLAPKGNELVKAAFNYRLPQGGTLRSFAELSKRPLGDMDYIQGTLCIYMPGDKYSIDMFSVIMDSTVIIFPEYY